ncbi:transmembrane protein 131, partial [Dorcoceras hygrometricum]
LISCKQCPINEKPNTLEIGTCVPHGAHVDPNLPDVLSSYVNSELASTNYLHQQSLENVCPPSNSFCFPVMLTDFLSVEVDTEIDAIDENGVPPENFAAGFKQVRSNLSWSADRVIFRLLGESIVSCSFNQGDGYHGLPSNNIYKRRAQQTDAYSCIRPLSDHKNCSLNSGEKVDNVKFGLTEPLVEIKPSLLDWGLKKIYAPSLAFLVVKNIDTAGVLSVYDPYSSNTQFYPCNFSETLLAPGEIATIWNTFRASSAICSINTVDDSREFTTMGAKEVWGSETGEVDLTQIFVRPHMNWEIGPKKTETIMELHFPSHFEEKIVGTLCMLLKSSENKIDTVMIPLGAELSPYSAGHVSASLEALVPCNASGSSIFVLSVRNDAPYLLRVVNVSNIGDGAESFQIKSIEGLILFPRSTTRVAILNYTRLETPEVNSCCKFLIRLNYTRNSQIEIPCMDVVSFCSGYEVDSSVGYTGINNVVYINGRQKSFIRSMYPPSEDKPFMIRELPVSLFEAFLRANGDLLHVKPETRTCMCACCCYRYMLCMSTQLLDDTAVVTIQPDEFILRNWKSHANLRFQSVLVDRELLFPVVHVGNHCYQWISVRNPSQEPVVMQFILNPWEVIDKCKTPEFDFQSPSSTILWGNRSIAPTRYGFSLGQDAITEAFVHPYGSASFGPVLFQPSKPCEWRSSALIRNNLSGVEWLSLRGFGGSRSLVLLDGSKPVQSLDFKLDFPTQLNISSPGMLPHIEGKNFLCHQSLRKEVYAKNVGDLPLEVIQIKVSGAECSLDGFQVHNCKGFSLQPGESVSLQISYWTDFSSSTIQRDLELALATGNLVIPMKTSLSLFVLCFCRRYMFWTRVKKAMVVILFASLLFLLVSLLLTSMTPFTYRDSKSGMKSSNVNRVEKSVEQEEALVLGSADRCSDGYSSGCGPVNQSEQDQKQKVLLLDTLPEATSASSALSETSSGVYCDGQDTSNSRNLRVTIGREKLRRRKKKKNSAIGLFEISSSQSGNSTPSSPLSPLACLTPKPSCLVSPDRGSSLENIIQFAQKPDQKLQSIQCSESPPQLIHLDDEVSSNLCNDKWRFTAQHTPSLTREVACGAGPFTSATFPMAAGVSPPWACYSPDLISTSTISPRARAPGHKVHGEEAGDVEKKASLDEKESVKDKFIYNIWADNLLGLHLIFQSKTASRKSPRAIDDNFESFFVTGPSILFANYMLNSPSGGDNK